MEALSDEDVVNSCQYVFDKFLAKESASKITEVKTSKWKTNGHFAGTYSYHPCESSYANDLAEPICNVENIPKILFAGEATHDHYFSTVHGAIDSGRNEAERLIKLYKTLL